MEIQATEVRGAVKRGKYCVIGKLASDRIISKETVKTTLKRLWKISEGLTFKVLGENLFLIVFEEAKDKARVLEGRPWVFEGNLFLVEEFDGRLSPSKFTFDKVSFWIRMIDLPLDCMGREVGFKLRATVGKVEEVDTDLDGIGWGEFLHVKIQIDITKPLPRGRKLKYQGEMTWIPFQHEKVPKFCFQCGFITHAQEGCTKKNNLRNQEDLTQFGPWMRAASPTRWTEKYQEKYTTKVGRADTDQSRYENFPRRYVREERARYDRRRYAATAGEEEERGGTYFGKVINPTTKKEREIPRA